MDLIRKTYVEINLKNIEENVRKVIQRCNTYKYYFGVIKADSYGLGDINNVDAIINGGCNYLAVATLEEALEIRSKVKDTPILCFGRIPREYLDICHKNNITITINTLEYLKEIEDCNIDNLKVHIKTNTGMNRMRNIKFRRVKRSI